MKIIVALIFLVISVGYAKANEIHLKCEVNVTNYRNNKMTSRENDVATVTINEKKEMVEVVVTTGIKTRRKFDFSSVPSSYWPEVKNFSTDVIIRIVTSGKGLRGGALGEIEINRISGEILIVTSNFFGITNVRGVCKIVDKLF